MSIVSLVIGIAVSSLAFQAIGPSPDNVELRLGRFGALQLRIQTEAELQRVIGSDAGQVVRDAIGRFPNIVDGLEPRHVNVVAEQLGAQWLPRVEGVWFQRFSVNRDGWIADCARVMWVAASRDGESLKVTVSEGNQCTSTGQIFAYTRDGQRWKADPRLGDGMASGNTGYCGCK